MARHWTCTSLQLGGFHNSVYESDYFDNDIRFRFLIMCCSGITVYVSI